MHSGETHICKQCEYQTHSQRLFHWHINVYHEEIKYLSKKCHYVASDKGMLKRHFGIKHGNVTHKCKECKYEAKSTTYYHIRSTHNSVIFQCSLCECRVGRKKSLNKHQKIVHEGMTAPKIACNLCDTKFTSQRGLELHRRNIHEQK